MPQAGAISTVLMDACCTLNLYATRRIEEILRAFPMRIGAAERVVTEVIYVVRGGGGDDAGEREIVNLQPLIADGLLQVFGLESTEEEATYLDFASTLDDGEAKTSALAIYRGYAVSTDDRNCRKTLSSRATYIQM